MMKVCFIGLGTMGGPMSANMAEAGFTVYGYSRTLDRNTVRMAAEAGVRVSASMRECVVGADLVCVCVGDTPDVKAVLFGTEGVVRWIESESTIVDFTTIAPADAQRIGRRLNDHGIVYLDAPVSGGDVGAREGNLVIMAGGSRRSFDAVTPIFDSISKAAVFCGPVGSGQVIKMCNQIMCAASTVATGEALRLASEYDIDPNIVIEACSGGAAGSWSLSVLGPRMIARDFKSGFRAAHMLKDLRHAEGSIAGSAPILLQTLLAEFENLVRHDGEAATQGVVVAPRPSSE